MSKAFVNEDAMEPEAGEWLPERPSEPLPITPRGKRALREEHEALVASGAAATRRARLIASILETVVEVAPGLHRGGAGFGCIVEVAHEDGAERSYELVGPDEASPRDGRISVGSPLARALLGAHAGDVVVVHKPQGEEELEVIAVRVPT